MTHRLKLRQVAGTVVVTVPRVLLKQVGLELGDYVVLEARNNEIRIQSELPLVANSKGREAVKFLPTSRRDRA